MASPGDLALKLFFALGRKHGMEIITLSHEPGVGFAADGYARATGKIGVICVTYGAGGHNMVNPVAGSFSERVPILIFSGGPGEEERKLGTLIHHQAREIESQRRIYNEVTCAGAVLTDPRTAADELHRVVKAIWAEQRPGYVEIHRDMVDRQIEVPEELIEWDGRLHFQESDARKVEEAAHETAAMFNASRKPVLIAGIEIHRFKASQDLVELAEKMGAPVMTTVLGKGAFPMDHPLYMGVHVGPISPPSIVARMDAADFVLNLGCLKTDMNFGNRPPHVIRGKTVWAVDRKVEVKYHTYTDVGVRDFARALLREKLRRHRETVTYADNLREIAARNGKPVKVNQILAVVNEFLARQARLPGGGRVGRHAVRRTRHSGAAQQRVFRAGLLRLDGIRGAGLARRANRQRDASAGDVRRRRLSDDRAGDFAGAGQGRESDRGGDQQRRMGHLPADCRAARTARDSAVAVCAARARLGRRRFRGHDRSSSCAMRSRAAHDCKSFVIIDVKVERDDLSPVTVKYIKAAAKRSQAPAEHAARGNSRA